MYPARALWEGKYSVDDLPDVIVLNMLSRGNIELYKGVWSGNLSLLGPLAAAGAFWGRPEPDLDETAIYFSEGYSEIEGWVPGPNLPFGLRDCLIGSAVVGNFILDKFKDTYQVSGIKNGTVIRQNSCLWTGAGITLKYDSQVPPPGDFQGVYATGTFKFKVNGFNKIGFNNTPVGSYAGGYTVS